MGGVYGPKVPAPPMMSSTTRREAEGPKWIWSTYGGSGSTVAGAGPGGERVL